MTVLKRAAEALDMDIPAEDSLDWKSKQITVRANEVVKVENAELPDLADTDKKMIEGRKELDELLLQGRALFEKGVEEFDQVEPQYRGRHLEVLSSLFSSIAGAAQAKIDLQIKIAKHRMDQANFSRKRDSAGSTAGAKTITNTVVYAGDRETLRKMFADQVEGLPSK